MSYFFKVDLLKIKHPRETGLSRRRTLDDSQPGICSRCVAMGCTVRYALIGESVGIYAWPRTLCMLHACRCEAISWLAPQLYRGKTQNEYAFSIYSILCRYVCEICDGHETIDANRIDQTTLDLTTKAQKSFHS